MTEDIPHKPDKPSAAYWEATLAMTLRQQSHTRVTVRLETAVDTHFRQAEKHGRYRAARELSTVRKRPHSARIIPLFTKPGRKYAY